MNKEIKALINENKLQKLISYFKDMNSVDIAKIMSELKDSQLVIVFRILPKDKSVEVFSYLDKEIQRKLIQSITDNEIKDIVEKLFLDDTVDFIEELPASVVKRVLKNTSTEKRELINQFLRYDESSAGAIMTIEFLDLKADMTVKEATNNVRYKSNSKEVVETCFVIDNDRKLQGTLFLKDLILNSEDTKIKDIMDKNIVYTKTIEDQEKVALIFKEYDLTCMPVVDKENRLVGIITVDDIIDIIEQENTEDFQKMAAMEPNEEPYLKTSAIKLAKHRIVWLLVLMISATFTGSIIKNFEDVLQSVVILAAFIPMLMDTGGNAGSQSSTLIIRGLALGDINIKDYGKVILKEFEVSIIVALALSSVNFLRIYFLEKTSLMISLTVCGSLFFTVIIAKVIGGALPIIAKKLKLDPAIMASPLITTVVDTCALIIYFTLAKLFLGI
ncbi:MULTISPECIES: magnesium transporter [unclassified Clostridium]|uniref:Magnesium transporter MgtE n=1 Tax=Clostridium botulinum (strain Eklund 17B / Type B) TaxID=935198 RepID=B2TMR3_CLOBB|nr:MULTISPECIES: magnesium transporter [unclassified Clostridium]ACD23211.1 magnesium transporter [Clostridium botulinum B str. Eklund 17B (NRP)]MBN1045552.1 magnesium transporter [Clostridium botulinum]MBN1052277.1 magnesium transporter [Clostridium botulinum]MBN1055408.1 magnesium transporter [Clostridium botulinum]MBY6977174.1 magnesium transporter [Clostridium botulinum]